MLYTRATSAQNVDALAYAAGEDGLAPAHVGLDHVEVAAFAGRSLVLAHAVAILAWYAVL